MTQTLLQGKPWKPSGETDVQETWRKFGWTPKHENQHPKQDVDDYDLVESQDWLSNGGFKDGF